MEKALRCSLILLALITIAPAVSSADELNARFAQHLEFDRISREREIARELFEVKKDEDPEKRRMEQNKDLFDILEKETRVEEYQHNIEMLIN